jgi:hypothetical protein
MNDESLEQIESQLAGLRPVGAPRELRGAVLKDVLRELGASRWDRWLAQAAAVLLCIGVGMNVAMGLKSTRDTDQARGVADSNARQSLVETALVVAEATDARTGREFARQFAAMIGHTLTEEDAAAIDAAVQHSPARGADRNKG